MRIRASAERQWRWRIKSDGGKSKTWRWCFEYCTFLQKIFSVTKIGRFLRRFDINSPFQNTVYPKTKVAFPKYKLELTTGIHACIDHAFVNIREFKMPRQPRKRRMEIEFTFFQSLSRLLQLAYFVKCKRTLLELNFCKPYPSS